MKHNREIILLLSLIALSSCGDNKDNNDTNNPTIIIPSIPEVNLNNFNEASKEEIDEVCLKAKDNFINGSEDIYTVKKYDAKYKNAFKDEVYYLSRKTNELVSKSHIKDGMSDEYEKYYSYVEGDKVHNFEYNIKHDSKLYLTDTKDSFKYTSLKTIYNGGIYLCKDFPLSTSNCTNIVTKHRYGDIISSNLEYKKKDNMFLLKETTITTYDLNKTFKSTFTVVFENNKYKYISYLQEFVTELENKRFPELFESYFDYETHNEMNDIKNIKDTTLEPHNFDPKFYYPEILNLESREYDHNLSIVFKVENYKIIIPEELKNVDVKFYYDFNRKYEFDINSSLISGLHPVCTIKGKNNEPLVYERFLLKEDSNSIITNLKVLEDNSVYDLNPSYPGTNENNYKLVNKKASFYLKDETSKEELENILVEKGKLYIIDYTFEAI